jgi:signal transduction histidine kinase/DNA-binding response OmpR family regulator
VVVAVVAAAVAAALRSGARRRPWHLAAAAGLAAALVSFTPLLDGLARALHDVQLRALAPRQPSPDVVVFDIDDVSLAALKPAFGAWPYQRDVYALAVEQLRELGARAIAIDLLLVDAQPADEALARAIARPGAPVLLAAAGARFASDHSAPRAVAPPLPIDVPAFTWPALAVPSATVWPAGRSPALGVITSPLEPDGVLRRLPLWHRDAQGPLPLMPWAVLLALEGPGAAPPPLDRSGAFPLALPAAPGRPLVRHFAELGLAALGEPGASPPRAPAAPTLAEVVRGRAVFIGSSALSADHVMTPQGQLSGTVALAQAYAQLRSGPRVMPPSAAWDIGLVLIASLPALAAVRRGRVRWRHELAATAAAGLALAVLAALALVAFGQPTAWAPPLAALAAGLAAALWDQQRGHAAAERRLAHQLAVSAEAARTKSAFLANVSHEIRTPLNALLGVAELLAQTELTPKQRLHVQVFRESGQALHALINDLLDLSKIEAGRLEVHAAPFDLHHCLQRLVQLMRPRAEDKGLALRLELSAALPRAVLGDRLRIEQGLVNLLGNAVKFTARGEVCLRAAPEPEAPGQVRFEVSDTGIGIAASQLETIFEPFAQADTSVTRTYGGTGLGLAITRHVAQLMGGTVQVASTPGVGSTFVLRLPLPAVELPALPQAETATSATTTAGAFERAGGGQALSVLLAEDNEINAYIFRTMLEGESLAIEYAANGPSALDLLRRRRYDIAFLDVQMPGLDGLSVTRELRRLEAAGGRARTPVVALTASAFASDVQASLAAGCDAHLAKPFSRAQLIDALQRLATTAPQVDAAAGNGPVSAAAQPSRTDPPGRNAAAEGATEEALDRSEALRRLDGNAALLQRLGEQAAVFMVGWAAAFDAACQEGSRERAHRLAHDLKGVAATVGARALAGHAAALEQSLAGPGDGCTADALARDRTMAALPAVVAALTVHRDASVPSK